MLTFILHWYNTIMLHDINIIIIIVINCIYIAPIQNISFYGALHCISVIGSGQPAVSNQFWGGATSSQLNSLGSIQGCCLIQHTHLVKPLAIITCLSLVLEELEALWLGMNLMVHRWSLKCAKHKGMIAHTPAFFTESGTTCMYVECSIAGPSHISHYGAMPPGWSPIHVFTGLMTV